MNDQDQEFGAPPSPFCKTGAIESCPLSSRVAWGHGCCRSCSRPSSRVGHYEGSTVKDVASLAARSNWSSRCRRRFLVSAVGHAEVLSKPERGAAVGPGEAGDCGSKAGEREAHSHGLVIQTWEPGALIQRELADAALGPSAGLDKGLARGNLYRASPAGAARSDAATDLEAASANSGPDRPPQRLERLAVRPVVVRDNPAPVPTYPSSAKENRAGAKSGTWHRWCLPAAQAWRGPVDGPIRMVAAAPPGSRLECPGAKGRTSAGTNSGPQLSDRD